MMEAIYCGCHPLLPNKLTYPELIPENLHQPLLHAPILYENEDALFDILKRILRGEDRPLPADVLREIPAHLAWSEHIGAYDALFEEAAGAALCRESERGHGRPRGGPLAPEAVCSATPEAHRMWIRSVSNDVDPPAGSRRDPSP